MQRQRDRGTEMGGERVAPTEKGQRDRNSKGKRERRGKRQGFFYSRPLVEVTNDDITSG